MRKLLFFSIIFLWWIAPLRAGSNPAAYLKAGVGARALGMGGAFTAVADDPSAAYWNPAGIGQIKKLAVTTMVQKLGSVEYDSLQDVTPDYQYATVLIPLHMVGLYNIGTVGLSWMRNSLDDIPWTTVDALNNIHQDSFSSSENAYILSYGQSFIDSSFFVGASIKFLDQKFTRIADASAAGYGLEAGILYHLDRRLSMGLVSDSGVRMKWSSGHEDRGSIRNKVGMAYKVIDRQTMSFLASTDIIQTRYRPLEGHTGGEFSYAPSRSSGMFDMKKLALRFGIDGIILEDRYSTQGIVNDDINWTMGAGFTFNLMGQELGIDYSFGSYRLGARHRISFNFLFL